MREPAAELNPIRSRLLLAGAVGLLLWVASPAQAAQGDEIAELRRAVEALRAENRALAHRLATLEGKAPQAAVAAAAAPAASAASAASAAPARVEQRLKELELAKAAQEDAVRSIIRDSLSRLGSKVNEVASFSGTLSLGAGSGRDFSGARTSGLGLSGLDLEFELQPSPWVQGHVKLEALDGRDTQFIDAAGRTQSVDRLTLDTATLTLGDLQRFPLALSTGRMVLPFGISTGRPVADVLSLASPLTVEVFETRAQALALNLAWPTPPLTPPTPPVVAPPVRPLIVGPGLTALGEALGYQEAPQRLKPLSGVSLAAPRPAFNAGLLIFEGRTGGALKQHYGATAGFHAKGHCGRPYEELKAGSGCPWALNVDVNYNSSIFNSRFLQTEYEAFLGRIGRVPAAAASVKAALGPLALVGEWNSATRSARFADDTGRAVAIRPMAWQAALGWQLDWNPWVEEIGAQGTYVALGYSESRGLAGVTRIFEGAATRVGFAPRRRLLVSVGEWPVEGLRVVLELARNWDYARAEGGTGRGVNSLNTTLSLVW